MKRKLIIFLFILAVIIPASFSNWGLTESSEARYAEISKEMYATDDYIHPKLLGIQHYHKPPVTYYITSLGYYLFGINEFGARFFLHIALLIQLWLVYKITQLLYNDKRISLTATLIYFSYPIVQAAANNLTTDAYLTTFIFFGIYFFLKYHQTPKHNIFIYLFYIFCGLAFLTKGPVGILPQILFAVFYTRILRIKSTFNIHNFLALILGIAICVSWFVVLVFQNKNFLNYFLRHQIVDRVASDAFKRSKPFWYYFVTMPLLGLPAFYYIINYLAIKFRSLHFRRTLAAVLLITLAILLLVFSASSSKLILYVLPLYLFIAILSAKHLSLISLKTIKIFENISFSFSYVIFTGLIVACFIPLQFVFPKIPVLLLSVGGIICMLFFSYKNFQVRYIKAPFINALTISVLTFVFPFIMKANDLKINSVKSVANFIKQQSNNKPGSIAVYDYLLPSLAFYANEKIITLNNGNPVAQRETQFEANDSMWESSYFKLNKNKDSTVLTSLLAKPNSYIIALAKNALPDSLSILKKNLPNKIVMEKWIIYY